MKLIMMIGLQASGKSTFARSRFGETYQYVSKDLFGGKKNHARRQRQLIEAALQRRLSVVVDNTNPTIEVRKELIELSRLYDAEVITSLMHVSPLRSWHACVAIIPEHWCAVESGMLPLSSGALVMVLVAQEHIPGGIEVGKI
jgi:predicted kinase